MKILNIYKDRLSRLDLMVLKMHNCIWSRTEKYIICKQMVEFNGMRRFRRLLRSRTLVRLEAYLPLQNSFGEKYVLDFSLTQFVAFNMNLLRSSGQFFLPFNFIEHLKTEAPCSNRFRVRAIYPLPGMCLITHITARSQLVIHIVLNASNPTNEKTEANRRPSAV